MTDDVVAELDAWLEREATTPKHYPADDVDTGLLQRARDEIIALRGTPRPCTCHPDERPHPCQLRYAFSECMAAYNQVRDAALEEATVVCLRKARDYVISIGQDNHHDGCVSCAAAIRALKKQ